MSRLARLHVRTKLTLVFACAMAVALAGLGWWMHLRVRDDIDTSIREALRARSGGLAASVRGQWPNPGRLIEPGERYAQVLGSDGSVIASRPEHDAALLSPLEVRRALRHSGFVERPEQLRLLTRRLDLRGTPVVTVVASSLAQRESAVEGVGKALAIGGALALVLASVAAYLVAAGALRPVERMRRRAEQIRAADTQARLPVPAAQDELGRLADTLNQMLARITRSAESERAFIANASHELRTPLAALRTELELARDSTGGEPELRAAIEASLADVDRLGRLAEDLLVLARLDEGRMPIRREALPVRDLFAGAERAWARGDRRVTFADPGDLTIDADPVRAGQALGNLIDNALRHGVGAVAVDARRQGATTVLCVEDDGPPLDPVVLDSAFERFTSFGGDPYGSGLGLALVQAIARAHRGWARLENTPEGHVRAMVAFETAEAPAIAGASDLPQ